MGKGCWNSDCLWLGDEGLAFKIQHAVAQEIEALNLQIAMREVKMGVLAGFDHHEETENNLGILNAN